MTLRASSLTVVSDVVDDLIFRKGLIALATDTSRDIRERVESEVKHNTSGLMEEVFEAGINPWDIFDNLVDERGEVREVFEFYIVSHYLYRQLQEHGEPVADIRGTKVWGRTTTGQAVYLDGVMQDIFGGNQ